MGCAPPSSLFASIRLDLLRTLQSAASHTRDRLGSSIWSVLSISIDYLLFLRWDELPCNTLLLCNTLPLFARTALVHRFDPSCQSVSTISSSCVEMNFRIMHFREILFREIHFRLMHFRQMYFWQTQLPRNTLPSNTLPFFAEASAPLLYILSRTQ